jgi:hypothetical protein
MADKDLYDNPWPSNSQRPKSPTSTINTSTNPWRSRRASTSHSTTAGRRSYSPSLSLSSASSFGELETDGLTGEGIQHGRAKRPVQYRQGGTIGEYPATHLHSNDAKPFFTDWQHEESLELHRLHSLSHSSNHSTFLSRLRISLVEGTRIWLVLGLTGVGVGLTGAWLDILVAWLSDLRSGRCRYGFFYNEVACCSGLDGERGELYTYIYLEDTNDFQRVRSVQNGNLGAITSMYDLCFSEVHCTGSYTSFWPSGLPVVQLSSCALTRHMRSIREVSILLLLWPFCYVKITNPRRSPRNKSSSSPQEHSPIKPQLTLTRRSSEAMSLTPS